MAAESMIRNLAAQATVIWPEEAHLLERYGLPARPRIADIGCGSGEIAVRLARRFPEAQVVGIDVLEEPLAYARDRHAHLGERVRFEQGDAFALRFEDGAFDLVVCRHVTQSVPEPLRLLAELVRVCRPGGWLHVLSEDYGMIHFPDPAIDRIWDEALRSYSRDTRVSERIGRSTLGLMARLGIRELRVDYVVVDTLRVPREPLAEIFRAWRDGYAATLESHARWAPGEAVALFDRAIAAVLDPDAYVVWHVPVVSGQKPDSS
jgi:ubiquinone/menaquinone biosynthesis C-methylase UbiE